MFALKPWRKASEVLPRIETPLAWMPEEFGTYFNRLFGWPVAETSEWPYGWGLTTEEKEKEVVVRIEVPGFEPEEVKVEVRGEMLTVEAEHKETPEKAEGKEKERAYAHAKRAMTLPPGVELEKAEAFYRNGVLEVHVPRKPEKIGRRIEVKT